MPATMRKGLRFLPFLLPFINYFSITNCEYEFVIMRMDFLTKQYSFCCPFRFFPDDVSTSLWCSKKSLPGQDLIFINFPDCRTLSQTEKPTIYNPPSLSQQQNTDEDRTLLCSSGEEVGAKKMGWFCYCCCCRFILFSFYRVCVVCTHMILYMCGHMCVIILYCPFTLLIEARSLG